MRDSIMAVQTSAPVFPSSVIIIKDLSQNINLKSLTDIFEQVGIIQNSFIFYHSQHMKKIAFIEFTHPLEADTAVAVLDDIEISGVELPLLIDYADRSINEGPLFLQGVKSEFASSLSSSTPTNSNETTVTSPPNNNSSDSINNTSENSSFPVSSIYEPPLQPIIQVTIRGVPPETDILSFSFLKPFGAVLEGRMLSEMSTVSSPDGTTHTTPIFTGVVIFTILTHSTQCAENLLSLNDTIGNSTSFLFSMAAIKNTQNFV